VQATIHENAKKYTYKKTVSQSQEARFLAENASKSISTLGSLQLFSDPIAGSRG